MRALEQLHGLRVVADPAALDDARWSVGSVAVAQGSAAAAAGSAAGAVAVASGGSARPGGIVVLRIAPDEAFAVGATDVEIRDPHAIVEPEAGFAGRWLTEAELGSLVAPHLEWPLPPERPALAQGSVAGVPARIWLRDEEEGGAESEGRDGAVAGAEPVALLVTAAAHAHELEMRLR